jgi:hypothetical protein
MTNIGAINSKHTKTYGVTNGMPCRHHMEDQFIINHKGQQYF